MKVFAMGGYGAVGSLATKLLARNDLITEIAIAGRNQGRAEKVAAEIGEKATAVQADAKDEEKLISLLSDYDIIMNGAGNDSVVPVIRAAIRARTHYCDVNFRIEQALQLSSEAEATGITAIIANGGGAPGICNLMGVHVADQLEEVEQLQDGIAFMIDMAGSKRELVPQQWHKDLKESLAALHECRSFVALALQLAQGHGIRPVVDYQDGRYVEADPVRTGLDVPTTQGGSITLYPYYSGDLFLPGLPHNLSAAPPVELWFSPLPPQLHELLREHVQCVIDEGIDSITAAESFYDTVDGDPQRWLTPPNDFVVPPELWVRSVGRKEGRAARCTCWLQVARGRLYLLTSAALSVVVLKILRGEIQKHGVLTAKETFDPLPFFDEVAAQLPDPPQNGKLIGESFEWLE